VSKAPLIERIKSLLKVGPLQSSYGVWSEALPAGPAAEPQPKSNLVHYSLKIWHLVAAILVISHWGNFSKVAFLAICEIFRTSRGHDPCGPMVNTPVRFCVWYKDALVARNRQHTDVAERNSVWSSLLVHVAISCSQRHVCRCATQQKRLINDKHQKTDEHSRLVRSACHVNSWHYGTAGSMFVLPFLINARARVCVCDCEHWAKHIYWMLYYSYRYTLPAYSCGRLHATWIASLSRWSRSNIFIRYDTRV